MKKVFALLLAAAMLPVCLPVNAFTATVIILKKKKENGYEENQ